VHACIQSAQNINLPVINGVVMQNAGWRRLKRRESAGDQDERISCTQTRLFPVIKVAFVRIDKEDLKT